MQSSRQCTFGMRIALTMCVEAIKSAVSAADGRYSSNRRSEAEANADKLVQRLASGPTRGLAAIKLAMRKGWQASLDEQLAEIQRPWDAAAALREVPKRAPRVLDETGNITLGSARRLA